METTSLEYRCPMEQHKRLGNEDHGLRAACIELRHAFARMTNSTPAYVVVTWGWGLHVHAGDYSAPCSDGCEWVVTLVAFIRPE